MKVFTPSFHKLAGTFLVLAALAVPGLAFAQAAPTFSIALNVTGAPFAPGDTVSIDGAISAADAPEVGSSCYYVLVDWGDTTTSVATIPPASPAGFENGSWDPAGGTGADSFSNTYTDTHTYAADGVYMVTVQLKRVDGPNGGGQICAVQDQANDPVRASAVSDVTVATAPVTATLTVIKQVVGGPLAAADFELSVEGPSSAGGYPLVQAFPGSDVGTDVTITQTGVYRITEVIEPDYAISFVGNCEPGEGGAAPPNNGFIFIDLAAIGPLNFTCTVVNTYTGQQGDGTITVIKNLINDGRGTAVVADFPLQVTPVGGSAVDVVSGDTNTFAAGDYAISEIYDTQNGVNGVGYYRSFSGDCDGSGNLTLAPGQDAVCTITNDDFTGPTGGGGGGGTPPSPPSPPSTPPSTPGGGDVLGEEVTQEPEEEPEEEPVVEEPEEELEEEGEVLAETTCGPTLTTYIHILKQNDADDVRILQNFLNSYMNMSLEVNGVYDQATFEAVKQFQVQEADEVLTPWGITQPTGYVYITTKRWVNALICPPPGPMPSPLVPDTNIHDNV